MVLSLCTKACMNAITPSVRAVLGKKIRARYYLPLFYDERAAAIQKKDAIDGRYRAGPDRTHKASEFIFAETTE